MTKSPIRKTAVIASLLALLASCEQPEPGEAIVRTQIGAGEKNGDTAQSGQTSVESPCRSIIFEDSPFTHCVATPARHTIRTVLNGTNGVPLRSLAALSQASTIDERKVAFAMNGGMYQEDGSPLGYYVQGGDRTSELNRADGDGNFYLKPNGVFFGTDGKWEVRTTSDFLNNVQDRPQFGTQSGPMLVIDGVLHPAIAADGESKAIRNAVGVDLKGRAHFVISNAPVSFGKIARLYRDKLQVRDALYLDGNVSALWSPAANRMDGGAPIGPILLVEKKAAAHAEDPQ